MPSFFFKDICHRRVNNIPNGVPRSAIIEAFHNHDLMINTIYPGQNNMIRRELYSTTYTSMDPRTHVSTTCTLTSLQYGFSVLTDAGLGNRITSQWTVQDGPNADGSEKPAAEDRTKGPSDLYLLEEITFRLFKPIGKWAQLDLDKSPITDRIIKMLEQMAQGNVSVNNAPVARDTAGQVGEEAKPE